MTKERYTIEQFELDEPNCIFDNKTQNVIFTLSGYYYDELSSLMNLLNQQDTRIKEFEEENQQLKQQLEEKDKVIEMQKSIQRYDIGDMLVENTKLKQSQKEHVINVLENIMSLCRNGISDYYSLKYVYTIIDNQIKELRSEK